MRGSVSELAGGAQSALGCLTKYATVMAAQSGEGLLDAGRLFALALGRNVDRDWVSCWACPGQLSFKAALRAAMHLCCM